MEHNDHQFKFDTLALHAGQTPDSDTGARVTPIFQTTSFVFRDTEHAANLFSLKETGHIYTRISNPTTAAFEARMAALEGGSGAVSVSSGQAAVVLTVLTLLKQGDEIVASSKLYGGTVAAFGNTLPRWGITTRFVDPADSDGFRAAINDRTKLVFGETIGNPRVDVFDFEAISTIAHEAGLPLAIDNTFASPYLCRPFEHGVDIVVHSSTKYIGGHGTSIGGVIVDSGAFDWAGSGRFPELVEPDPSYHGVSYVEDFGPAAFATKVRAQMLRDLGPAESPFNSFLFLQGLETLPLRMQRHSQNAQRVAEFLEADPRVGWVAYPGLANHPTHALAGKYLPKGCGGMMAFGVKGGRDTGGRFIDALQLVSHLANVGDAKSLAVHPATTTHQQLTQEQLEASGVTEDLIRLSVGIEDIDDILWDLDQALAAAVS